MLGLIKIVELLSLTYKECLQIHKEIEDEHPKIEWGKGRKEFGKEYQIVNSHTYKKRKITSDQIIQIKTVEFLSHIELVAYAVWQPFWTAVCQRRAKPTVPSLCILSTKRAVGLHEALFIATFL